jgi:hypothetical protein
MLHLIADLRVEKWEDLPGLLHTIAVLRKRSFARK